MTAFQEDVSCVSHWWGLLLTLLRMYSIDYIHCLSTTKYQLKCPTTLTTIRHQVPRNYTKEYQRSRRKTDRERKKIKWNKMKNERKQTCAQGAGRVLRGQGCCLLVRSVLWRVQLMDSRRTTKKARWRTSQDEKNKSRPQRRGGFALNVYLPGVPRQSGVISHDISRYIVISYPISCDITRYDISRYCIRIPKYWAWHRDIASRRNIPWYRTHFSPIGAPSLVHQESKRRNGYLEVELQKQWYLFENIYVRPYGDTQTVGLDAVPEKKTQ